MAVVKICKNGHLSERTRDNRCAECRRLYRRTDDRVAYYKQYNKKRYLENTDAHKQRGRKSRERDVKKNMLRRAKRRAVERGLDFLITLDDFSVPQLCPLLGVELRYGAGSASPSLDRIKPELGYVPGNVWVISHRANAIKQDANLTELKTLVANLEAALLWKPYLSGTGCASVEKLKATA